MKRRKPVHTIRRANTVVETLKALGFTEKDYLKVVNEIKKLKGYEPFPER